MNSNPRNMDIIMDENYVQGFIARNKVIISIALAVVIVLVLVLGYVSQLNHSSKAEFNDKIFAFESTTLTQYKATHTPEAAVTLENGVVALHNELGNYIGLLPLVIKSSDALVANGENEKAKNVLEIGQKISGDDYSDFFVYSRLAAVYEDLGANDQAIAILKKMTSLSHKTFEGKIYLDLGRLQLKAGNKEEAKKSFSHVVEKANTDAEFVRLAKLHLSTL